MHKKILVFICLGVVLTACGRDQATLTAPAPTTISEAVSPAEPESADKADPVNEEVVTAPTDTPQPVEPTASPVVESEGQAREELAETEPGTGQASPIAEPIEVTYFTPSQGEGPYYTVEKPADRDNDLTVFTGATGMPAGQVIEFSGKVYNANGLPLTGLTVEIWQTDHNGVYLHPADAGTANRDQNFQFYGESVTAEDGTYNFRTILPGQYEPRPRHIHLKVKNGEQELLTSQIYFNGDPSLETDGLFLNAGAENEHLIMTLAAGQDAAGNPILVGEHNLILNTTLLPSSPTN